MAKILDYVEQSKDTTVILQWVAIAILVGGLFGGLWHLSSRIDATRQELKADMKAMENRIIQKHPEA